MIEEWKDIIIEKNGVIYDYTGLYQVSNYGRVRSLDRIDARGHKLKGRILKIKPGKNNYMAAILYKNGKTKSFYVHRLVATMFIPNPNSLPFINHKDENPSNCYVDNLEWCTQQYNTQYSSYKISESLKDKPKSEEHKRKMSESQKGEKHHSYGKQFSEEHKRKISESLKGKPSPYKGVPRSNETKQKMSESQKGHKPTNSKKVICVEISKVFNTIKEAEEWCGKKGIDSCLRGKTKTCGGYHWQYYNDYLIEQLIVN